MVQRAKLTCAVRVSESHLLGSVGDCVLAPFHLILLFETVALGGFHLVDVLEKVGHAHGRVQLPRVVG